MRVVQKSQEGLKKALNTQEKMEVRGAGVKKPETNRTKKRHGMPWDKLIESSPLKTQCSKLTFFFFFIYSKLLATASLSAYFHKVIEYPLFPPGCSAVCIHKRLSVMGKDKIHTMNFAARE